MTGATRSAARTSLDLARRVLHAEADALRAAAGRLDGSFDRVRDLLLECPARVAVSGVGKSADIGRKIVATFNSTGTRAYFLDAVAARHGDLGTVHPDDVALILSHGGESDEILRLLPPLSQTCAALTGITSSSRSSLARACDAVIAYGPIDEADPLGLAPSASTTVMLALGDALAFALAGRRAFTAADFARCHPAGSLGVRLARVEAYMRQGPALRLAHADEPVRGVFARPGRARRTGAVMIVDDAGRLRGLFTDSDLARLFERRADAALDGPIAAVMTVDPLAVLAGTPLGDALDTLRANKISELPVIDDSGRPVGLLDVTDLLHLMPRDDEDVRHAA